MAGVRRPAAGGRVRGGGAVPAGRSRPTARTALASNTSFSFAYLHGTPVALGEVCRGSAVKEPRGGRHEARENPDPAGWLGAGRGGDGRRTGPDEGQRVGDVD